MFMPYNPRYYPKLLEGCGLTKAKDLWSWKIDVTKPVPEKIARIAEKVRNREGIVVRQANLKNWDAEVKRFFVALGPAVIGSGGVQLALFADTIIASFLPTGAISALYYADRLNQLPIGVIGIAIGTVLLPDMSRRIAAGDEEGAGKAQNRAIEFALLLAMPCGATDSN